MFRIKKSFIVKVLMVGGLMMTSLFTNFSVAQNFGPTDSDLINRILNFLMPSYTVYLYAITEPNTYTIYFDGNGSTSGTMETMNMTYDIGANLLANNFTRDGFIFAGWSTTSTGAVEYLDQSEVTNLTADKGGEVTLYAQRSESSLVPYTIEYYQENLDGTGYDLVDTSTEYGPVGPGIITTGTEYTGFTLQTGAAIDISSGGIVPYYYSRNTYNLIVKDRDNILIDTGIKYEGEIVLPADPTGWTGNTFSGWDNVPLDMKMPANDLEITSIWNYGVHSITFDTDGGSEIDPITGNYGDPIDIPPNPSKDGYEFVRWEPEIPTTMPYDDITVTAVWREINKDHGSGWSGRGRSLSTPDNPRGGEEHGSATDQDKQEPTEEKVDLDVLFAYMWAHDLGIIDESWQDADPDGYVTRGAMAEMVVRFTEKVLERDIPPVPKQCAWGDSDSEWGTPETKAYAEKACALGVMGIRMKDFMPNKILDRAEFGTILSRLLWGDKYDVVDATSTKLYYTRHLDALSEKKIMTKIEDPESQKELRKWAWLMLMRARVKERIQG